MSRIKTLVSVVSRLSERPVSGAAALIVIHGQDIGRKFELAKDTTTIGRSTRADIQVDQESVSRNHARLYLRSGKVLLSDLGSTNGTFLNDEPLKSERALHNGDFVKIGRTIFKYIDGGNIEQAYHEEIYRMMTVDGLTQVYNRRYFEEALEREVSRGIRYSRELTLVLMDIDHFKQVNDQWGHLAGDSVLKTLASVVKNNTRREDVFARFGGEEFALLLPEVDIRGAVLMAEKIRRMIQNYVFTFDGETMPVTISAGVAALGVRQREAPELIRGADARLYEAKQTGRNRVCA